MGRSSIHPGALALGRAMVKETKFFRKQAAKAERMSRSVSDPEISESFLNIAKAYRSQADVCYSAWGLTLDRRPRLTPVDAQQRIVSTN